MSLTSRIQRLMVTTTAVVAGLASLLPGTAMASNTPVKSNPSPNRDTQACTWYENVSGGPAYFRNLGETARLSRAWVDDGGKVCISYEDSSDSRNVWGTTTGNDVLDKTGANDAGLVSSLYRNYSIGGSQQMRVPITQNGRTILSKTYEQGASNTPADKGVIGVGPEYQKETAPPVAQVQSPDCQYISGVNVTLNPNLLKTLPKGYRTGTVSSIGAPVQTLSSFFGFRYVSTLDTLAPGTVVYYGPEGSGGKGHLLGFSSNGANCKVNSDVLVAIRDDYPEQGTYKLYVR